ncbi:hypothetical protein AB4Y32_32490 [Paraburkholderia phymatum]|uniref:Uncharacterized protein n=1 Tax=Paraburkholderia phymatum TaxID=148447 RepID=A0ACC6UA56_9BURK
METISAPRIVSGRRDSSDAGCSWNWRENDLTHGRNGANDRHKQADNEDDGSRLVTHMQAIHGITFYPFRESLFVVVRMRTRSRRNGSRHQPSVR